MFSKNGLDVVNIYSRLKGQGPWSFLARDTNLWYDDHKALANGSPETREYMCISVMEDAEAAQQSDIVSVGVWRIEQRDATLWFWRLCCTGCYLFMLAHEQKRISNKGLRLKPTHRNSTKDVYFLTK